MRKKVLVIGIDISQGSFHVCAKERADDGSIAIKGTHSFTNDNKGFIELLEWVSKRVRNNSSAHYIMEATGTYYENLAYFLHEKGQIVSVELANKLKYFAKSLNVKSKTDKIDSKTIAEIGIERELTEWKPMSIEFKEMRDLSREILSLKKEKARSQCQLHAMEHSHEKTTSVLKIKESQIAFYSKTIKDLEDELTKVVKKDPELKERIDKVTKIKGLGFITVVIILCETNGFGAFNNIRQVVSYAGLDVQLKESGNFKGKTRISKKGNARIRQGLYMPALSATMYNDKIKSLYERVNERNPGIKKKGVVAGMRKLLILMFVIWKKNTEYDQNYQWGK